MAHIIAFMDDTLHVETRPHRSPAEAEPKRQVGLTQHRRTAQPRAAGGHSAEDAAPVRMDRVQALRASIADGTYAVSAADLADKILHSMLKP